MNTKHLISKFIAQLCEKQFAYANSTLTSILEAKIKDKIKNEVSKKNSKNKMQKGKMMKNKKNPKMAFKKTK